MFGHRRPKNHQDYVTDINRIQRDYRDLLHSAGINPDLREYDSLATWIFGN